MRDQKYRENHPERDVHRSAEKRNPHAADAVEVPGVGASREIEQIEERHHTEIVRTCADRGLPGVPQEKCGRRAGREK